MSVSEFLISANAGPQILPPPLYNININVQFADFPSAYAGAFNQYVQNFEQLLFNVLIESDV